MKRLVLALALVSLSAVSAGAQTLDFETAAPDLTPIPNGYGGLNWANMYALNATNYCGSCGYRNGLASGDFVAFNAYGAPAALLQSVSPFTLNSAWFGAAWTDGLVLTATGYVASVATYTGTYTLSTAGSQLVTFNWAGVDQVDFSTSDNSQFVLDDLTVNAVVATPEPASLVLLGTGLLGVFGAARIRRRNTAR